MQMQILIAFTGCRDMARPSVLWPFGGMKLPFLCCAHCLFPMLEFINQNLFPPRPDVPFVLTSLTVPVLQVVSPVLSPSSLLNRDTEVPWGKRSGRTS